MNKGDEIDGIGLIKQLRCTIAQSTARIAQRQDNRLYRMAVQHEQLPLLQNKNDVTLTINLITKTKNLYSLLVNYMSPIGYVRMELSNILLISNKFIKLELNGKLLDDNKTFKEYNIKNNTNIYIILNYKSHYIESFIYQLIQLSPTYLDPEYDKDYTNIINNKKIYYRGGTVYVKPYGWKRYGVRVLDNFENNNWLSSDGKVGEWSVYYHGTDFQYIESININGLKIGKRNVYGKGVYCTPNPSTAEKYSHKFLDNNTNQYYKVILQCRSNPLTIKKATNDVKEADDYYLQEKECDIRHYGILIKPVK